MNDKKIESLAYKAIGLAIKVHKELGPGLLESTYEKCLCYELEKNNIKYENQKKLPIIYDNKLVLEEGYRIDILIENKIIFEIKAVEKLSKVHEAQILTYLKLSNKKLGYLINFNELILKNGIKRFIL
jgi:GxxExxY protein